MFNLFTFWCSGSDAFQVGIYAAVVRRLHIIGVILVLILCAKVVLRMLIINVYEETKDFVEHV